MTWALTITLAQGIGDISQVRHDVARTLQDYHMLEEKSTVTTQKLQFSVFDYWVLCFLKVFPIKLKIRDRV